jgi:hypothetical protein
MFKTISNQSKRLDLDIFRLNPINQFLIKKYPREQDKDFLGHYWYAYLITLQMLAENRDLDDVSISITPEEYYNIPNPSISSCFDEWLQMFKNDAQYRYIFLDNIPGSSGPLSMVVKGIPEESVTALREVLDKINTDTMISRNDIKKAIEDHREY